MSGVMKPLETLFGVVISRVLVEPGADVAVVGGDVAARVQPAAGFDDVGAKSVLRRGCSSRFVNSAAALLGAEVVRRAAGAQRPSDSLGAT